LINVLVNSGVARVSLMGEHRVPLWSVSVALVPSGDRTNLSQRTLESRLWTASIRRRPGVCRLLPDGSLGARHATNVEAVDPHLLAEALGVDVALARLRGGPALVALCVAGDERQALCSRAQVKAPQHAPDAVL
jgi:hypothetical protein